MSNNVVHIESSDKDNKSFGTGFVITNNEQGTYILTCQHVLDAVQNARIESKSIEVIASSDFLDMAIVFFSAQHYDPMQLQLDTCHNLNITTIAFSSFKGNFVQKSTIHATLFKDFIELHSTEDDAFYLMKKIKADQDYKFSRGNSGAPIICNKTGNVIAMLSNKEAQNIAYAIGISSIKRLLEHLQNNNQLMKEHANFYQSMSSFKKESKAALETKKSPKNRAIYHINELKKEKSTFIQLFQEKLMNLKYFLLGIMSIFALYGAYAFFNVEKNVNLIKTTEYYEVTNIPTHETLNVRKGAGRGYEVVYELLPNAKKIIVLGCKANDEGKKWCHIRYGDIEGWVHSYYIKKDTNKNPH